MPGTTRHELAAKERTIISLPEGKGGYRVVLAYPNRYWVAMSNLGFQAIYRLLCENSRTSVERAYLSEDDGEALRTFESSQPLSDAEILALSVSFETDYPAVLEMLRAAGIDLESRRELNPAPSKDVQRPFVLGGGPH